MRENRFIVWVLLAAGLLVVLNLPAAWSARVKVFVRDGLAPLQQAVSGFTLRTRESLRFIRGLGGLRNENQKLAAELAHLRGEVRALQALEKDNATLRTLLHFTRRSPHRLIPCEVIARDLTGWWQTARLGQGAAAGIARDRAVVTPDGLVGRTLDAGVRTTDVLLLSDPNCKVAALVPRTGSHGILSGTGPATSGPLVCRLDFINQHAAIQPGDEVVTSGLGGVFPRGLLIGTIDKVETDASGLFLRADVLPKADLGALDYVFVLAADGGEEPPR